jgi:hypothetical protein
MFAYIFYPLLFFPVYIYKKFTKNKVLVTYKQKCDDEFVFTYNYGNNDDLYSELIGLNIINYELIDDIENKKIDIIVKFQEDNYDSKSQEGENQEEIDDAKSSVGDSVENAEEYLKNNVVTFNEKDMMEKLD